MSSLLWCFERGLRIALYALEEKKGPHLAMTGEFHGFYQLGCEVGFLSSYDEDLREPLVCPQGSPVCIPLQQGARHCSRVTAGETGLKTL